MAQHHYIPEFYLQGFTDSQNHFFIFDKQTKKIWKSGPEKSFKKNNYNTGTILSPKTGKLYTDDLPEKVLGHFENRSSVALSEIRNSTKEDDILTPERLYAIRFFIVSSFWRSPATDQLKSEIIKTLSFEDMGFGIFNKDTGKRNVEAERIVNSIDLWQKMYQILIPVTSFTDKFRKLNADDWRLYYRNSNFHVTTDLPVIYEQYKDFSSLHEELIFPLSSKHLIVSTKGTKPSRLEPIFNVKVDLLLFYNAHRFVACSNRDYLEFLAQEVFTTLQIPDIARLLKNDIFNTFSKP